jgi:hypothetical protein
MSGWIDREGAYSDQTCASWIVPELARRRGLKGNDYDLYLFQKQMQVTRTLRAMRRYTEHTTLIVSAFNQDAGAEMASAITTKNRHQWIAIFVAYFERVDRREGGWLTEAHLQDAREVLHNMREYTPPEEGDLLYGRPSASGGDPGSGVGGSSPVPRLPDPNPPGDVADGGVCERKEEDIEGRFFDYADEIDGLISDAEDDSGDAR